MTKKQLRQLKKRSKADRQRNLRVVEYLDYSQIFERSPVEVTEGYVVSDVDDYSIFASFVFKNVSGKTISSLKIRLLCFSNQNIPYLKIPFEYCYEDYTLGERRIGEEKIKDKRALAAGAVEPSETFGEAVYIPIPETYFTRLELEITSAVYTDGTGEDLGIIAGKTFKRFQDRDLVTKIAYESLNIYVAAEEKYPIRVIPQIGKNAWLCCCGYKNVGNSEICERCKREKEWQEANLVEHKFEEVRAKVATDIEAKNAAQTNYLQNKYLESSEDVQKKIKLYETAMQNVAAEEKRRESQRLWLIPKIVLAIGAVWLLINVLSYLVSILNV